MIFTACIYVLPLRPGAKAAAHAILAAPAAVGSYYQLVFCNDLRWATIAGAAMFWHVAFCSTYADQAGARKNSSSG